MKSDIKDDLGQQIHKEISNGFLENFSGIADLIKDNFSQIRESSQQHSEGLQNLKNDIAELKAKDAQIYDLISKESELKTKLKAKDEVIEA